MRHHGGGNLTLELVALHTYIEHGGRQVGPLLGDVALEITVIHVDVLQLGAAAQGGGQRTGKRGNVVQLHQLQGFQLVPEVRHFVKLGAVGHEVLQGIQVG